jgi:DNA-binding MarR family transcriptional regulator
MARMASTMAKPADLTAPASELRIVLGQLVRRLRRENTVPMSQVTVLAWLERDGPMTTSALAAAERVRAQSMAHTVGELEAAGCVGRRPDPTDRRQVLIELTDTGRRTLSDDRLRRASWLAGAIESELTSEEQEALLRAIPLLRRLAQS